MQKQINVSIGQAEVILMTHLTDRDDYAKLYLEPNMLEAVSNDCTAFIQRINGGNQ